jgi:membrane-associated protein
MELLTLLLDFILHIDRHLAALVADYGAWIYVILFLIVFCETGLVVMPFLPGDSLLFVAGALAALGGMHIHLLVGLLIVAAILGDTLNYHVGKHLGHRLVARPDSRWFHHEWLDRTHAFYDRHGGKTVVIARFVPIVRTFAPFVAGMGSMAYGRFLRYNVLGGIAWVTSFAYAGYWFGNVPVVKQNLSLLIVAIVGVSMLPGVVGYLRHRRG